MGESAIRGVCCGYMNQILLTMFDSTLIYILELETDRYKLKDGCNYARWKTLKTDYHHGTNRDSKPDHRLQTVSLDSNGYIVTCDSKTHAVRILTYTGHSLKYVPTTLGCVDKGKGERPQGVAIRNNDLVVSFEDGDIFLYSHPCYSQDSSLYSIE